MRLLDTTTLEFVEFAECPYWKYAILSHRWGNDEVTFKEYRKNRDNIKHRAGYRKIVDFCTIARKRGFSFAWIDTCCIDKRSSAELSEAINSMYALYEHSAECYVWLKDYEGGLEEIGKCEWFTRGWTLQEMLASRFVVFFTSNWEVIGHKSWNMLPDKEQTRRLLDGAETIDESSIELLRPKGPSIVAELSKVTGVPKRFLDSVPVEKVSVAARMSWAAGRSLTRVEDRAYSLLGLFQVHMPLLYGEGNKAYIRLQEEIMLKSDDASIFCHAHNDLLARTPFDFRESGDVTASPMRAAVGPYSMTNMGLRLDVTASTARVPENIYRIELRCYKPSASVNDPLDTIPQFLYLKTNEDSQHEVKFLDDPQCSVLDQVRSWTEEARMLFYVRP